MSSIFNPKSARKKGWIYNPVNQGPNNPSGIEIEQITPIAIDLTLHSIRHYSDHKFYPHGGEVDNRAYLISNKDRQLPEYCELKSDDKGNFELNPHDGFYELIVQEKVRMPKTGFGICYLRSSLYRCGVYPTNGALFDPNYDGQINTFIHISVPLTLNKNFRPISFVFFKGKSDQKSYRSFWQGSKE